MTPAQLEVADWRRQVAELYAEVRALLDRGLAPAAHERWRTRRDELFATHPQSPLDEEVRAPFRSLDVAAYDPDYAVAAALEPVAEERFEIGRSGGGTMAFVRIGRASTPFGSLDCFWLDAYGGGLFVPFRDATSGTTTYGGGRYLLDTCKGADLGLDDAGRVRLDFNFAYHPSCHYAPSWSCPLAPPDSWLAVPIPVGEQRFRR